MGIASSPGSPIYHQQTERLLELATPDRFGWIQRITMRLDFEGCGIELTIDISNKRLPIKVSHLLKYPHPTHLSAAKSDYISSQLGTLVNGIIVREGVSKLQEGDLKQVHQIVRSIFMQRSDGMSSNMLWWWYVMRVAVETCHRVSHWIDTCCVVQDGMKHREGTVRTRDTLEKGPITWHYME